MNSNNQPYNKLFFDFDSTLIRAESLDILAELKGCGAEAKEMTEQSMNGDVPLEAVFEKKMDLMAPSFLDMQKVAEQCRGLVVADACEVVRALHLLKKEVFILSSNFLPIIEPLAQRLGISRGRILSNVIYFDSKGSYAGIESNHPLSKSSGKAFMLKKYCTPEDYLVMVGDSVSDLGCKEVANLFVGFGGVVFRAQVKENADRFIAGPSLAPLLFLVLSEEELGFLKHNGFQPLIHKALALTTTTTDTVSKPRSW